MPIETVPRSWTIASWLVAHAASELDAIGDALAEIGADAVAVQSLRENDAERLAARIGVTCAWELSFHPASKLIPRRGLGLAVLSPHDIADSVSVVTNNHSSTWSKQRRVAQFAVVNRTDHTGYTIGHAVGSPDPESMGHPPAPLVWFRPAQIGVDGSRAVDLPGRASVSQSTTHQPVDGAAPLLVVTFEMPWVQGDFPTG